MSKTPHPLRPSEEKIKRAEAKFGYLKGAINAYVASQPYSTRFDEQAGAKHLVARREKELPEDIGFEIVEAVGHLKSALDKMLVALVELNGRGISGVGFPFGSIDNGQPVPVPNGRTGPIEKKLTADQWTLVVAQRPYPGGNDTLWAINQIANTDKHGRDLVEVKPRLAHKGTGIGTPGTNWSGGSINVYPAQDDTLPYDYEREKVLVSIWGGSGQLGIRSESTVEVVFGEIAPVSGMNVLTTLNQQIRITERIVKLFRSAFF